VWGLYADGGADGGADGDGAVDRPSSLLTEILAFRVVFAFPVL
jgi:hypothetical protein